MGENVTYRACVFVVLLVSVVGCSRHSFRIRQAYDRGRYDAAVGRCQMDSTAASQRWNAPHRARYHVYCGMAYLGLGDGERAAVELVQAERMRQQDPRLVTGRDL